MKKQLFLLITALLMSWSASAQMQLDFNTNLSDGTTITLPLNGTLDVIIDWGDGSHEQIAVPGEKSHTYAVEGIYTVEISGTLERFGTSTTGFDFSKLTEVTDFGDLGLKSLHGAFSGAINLELVPDILPSTVTDLAGAFYNATKFNGNISAWDVSNVTSMAAMFEKATSFNQDISSWNVSNVQDMMGMFSGATSFNQDISSWNVSNVNDMMSMFANVTLSTANYSKILIGWAAQTVQTNIEFDGGNSKYYSGAAADSRANLISTYGWDITDGGNSGFTHIPDNNFLQALIDLGHGTGHIGNDIPTANLSAITELDVKFKTITDLTGIEAFIALKTLNCSQNSITNLDVSKNTALEVLVCSITSFTSLDLTKNTALGFFRCQHGKLISLDLRNGNNANLTIDAISNPHLTCIYVDDKTADLSTWTKDATATFVNDESECNSTYTYIPDEHFRARLNTLSIGVTFVGDYANTATISGITSLDLHNGAIFDLTGIEDFAALETLFCFQNGLTSLDLSKNTALEVLNCTKNFLTSLDVSKNTALTTFYCSENELTSLDVSKNTALTIFECNDNELSFLDVRNGNNATITDFDATNNPDLSCIYVDDTSASYLTGWQKDATATFVNNESECGYTYIPDDNFLLAITKNIPSAAVIGNYVKTADINTKTILSIPSYGITDLTGIQDFTSLMIFKCQDNLLTSIDLSENIKLQLLTCQYNDLTTLDLSKNIKLQSLTCNNNDLITLDLSANVALTKLTCNDNDLTLLDVRNGNNANFTTFKAHNNPDLTCIYVDDKTADLSFWEKDATATFVNTEAECGALTPVDDIKMQTNSIYPNPTNGIVNFDFSGEHVQKMKIVTIAGETVFQKENISETETIDISGFANGLYIVILQTDNGSNSFKIIKE